MGVDAEIYVRATDSFLWDEWAKAGDWMLSEDTNSNGTTHRFSLSDRYYDEGYARGFWPETCKWLMIMMRDKDFECIWYTSDAAGLRDNEPCTTIADILRISEFWMKNGTDPYRLRRSNL